MAGEMKDSGVEWIGEIPSAWEVQQIGHLYSERREKVSDTDFPPLSVTMKGILPQLSTAAKTDAHDDRKLVCKGDFAINSRSDRRGSCGISPYDGSVSLINIILIPRKKMHPVYYEWLFHSTMFSDEFYKWGHGIVDDLWTTSWQDMKKIVVPIPPYEVQCRIADYLNTECACIDKVIAQVYSSIEECKKLKQSVIMKAITKGIRAERTMKDSGIAWIGSIPNNWNREKVTRIFRSIGSGTTPKSDDPNYFKGNIHWIQSGDINGGILCDSKASVSDLAISKFSTLKIYTAPFIVMAMYGASIGNLSISKIDGCVNQACCVMQNGNQDIRYSYYALKVAKDYLVWKAVGGGQPNISQETIKQLWLPMPPYSEQVEIADFLVVS